MKRFILLSLFAATSLLSSIKDLDLNLENLTPAQLKKIEELSEISKKITQKQEDLKKLAKHFVSLLDCYLTDHGNSHELEIKLDLFVKQFEKAFQEKKNIKDLLAKGFSTGENYEFDFIKVFLVRRYFERILVAELTKQYEKKISEFLELSI